MKKTLWSTDHAPAPVFLILTINLIGDGDRGLLKDADGVSATVLLLLGIKLSSSVEFVPLLERTDSGIDT